MNNKINILESSINLSKDNISRLSTLLEEYTSLQPQSINDLGAYYIVPKKLKDYMLANDEEHFCKRLDYELKDFCDKEKIYNGDDKTCFLYTYDVANNKVVPNILVAKLKIYKDDRGKISYKIKKFYCDKISENQTEPLIESILIRDFNKIDKTIISKLIQNTDKKAISEGLIPIKNENQLTSEQKLNLGKRVGISRYVKNSIIAKRKAISGRQYKNVTFKTNRNFELVSIPASFNGRYVLLRRNNKAGTYTSLSLVYNSKTNPDEIRLKNISLNNRYLK